ncbi:hypothetical protein TYRP_016419 [Tyrophagus putrescentiae]|nr:hypothetical protein TYRP_016419 [Tyrophagus putrescentiae]
MIDTYLSPLTESLPTQVEPLELLLETLCRGETPFELVPSLAINSSGLRPPVASVNKLSALTVVIHRTVGIAIQHLCADNVKSWRDYGGECACSQHWRSSLLWF